MYPFFAIFLVFCLWVRFKLKKSSHDSEKNKSNFFELESEANMTRKKSIDNLDYIIFSEKSIPINEINDDELKKIQQELLNFRNKKIINLSGITNTELKKLYGPANLPDLTEYDKNYLDFVRTLHNYALLLSQNNYTADAIKVLEYSVEIGTDMGISYKLLADLYVSQNMKYKINDLLNKSDNINNLSRKNVIGYLKDCID